MLIIQPTQHQDISPKFSLNRKRIAACIVPGSTLATLQRLPVYLRLPDECIHLTAGHATVLLYAGAIMEQVISGVQGGVTGHHTHIPGHRI